MEEKIHKTRKEFLDECSSLALSVDQEHPRRDYIDAVKKIRAKFPDGHLGWFLTDVSCEKKGSCIGDAKKSYHVKVIYAKMRLNHYGVGLLLSIPIQFVEVPVIGL